MIAFVIGEPEQPLLQDRIALVPQGDAEAQVKMLVAKPADAVLAPAIGSAARVIMREIGPRIAIFAVILAYRSPLAIADIGPPTPPRGPLPSFVQPAAFCGLCDAVRNCRAASTHRSRQSCRDCGNSRCLLKFLPLMVRYGSAMVKVMSTAWAAPGLTVPPPQPT